MKRQSCFLFAVGILLYVIVFAGCLTDSDSDDNNSGTHSKKLSFPVSSLKLVEDYQVDLNLTIVPPADGNEWIVWTFTWPDSSTSFHTNAVEQPNLCAWPFKEGDLTLTATLYDSIKYKELGDYAADHGSTSIAISIRKIDVEIESVPGSSYREITFDATSPQKDYLWPSVYYEWEFGDNFTFKQDGADTVSHVYENTGTYIVSVTLSAALQKGSDHLTIIAQDTDTLTVSRPITEDLELVITPSDTLWNTATSLRLNAEPSLDRIEYPEQVRWVIDYGDGESTEDTGYLYDTAIYHHYSETGTYILTMIIYDHATGDLLAQDSATITIDNLPFMQETYSIHLSASGFTTEHHGTYDANGTYTETLERGFFLGVGGDCYDLVWNGQNFFSENTSGSDTHTRVIRFEGTLSPDGTMLERLEFSINDNETNYQDKGYVRTTLERIVLSNVPLTTIRADYKRFFEESSDIGQYVTEFEDWFKLEFTDGTANYSYFGDYEWQNTSKGIPNLTVEFK